MWEFFVFWFTAIWLALKSAWGLAGVLDLMITMIGVAVYDRLRDRGPRWLRDFLADKLPSKGGFILAMFLVWFVPATFIFAPYWQFKDEREKRLAAEKLSKPSREREWPSLTEKQINEWVAALRPYHIKELNLMWSPEVEASQFASSLKAIGKRLGVPVNTGMGATDSPEIEVTTLEDEPAGPVLVELIKRLNCPAKLRHEKETFGQGITIVIPERFQ